MKGNNICFTKEAFLKAVKKLKKNKVIVWDEYEPDPNIRAAIEEASKRDAERMKVLMQDMRESLMNVRKCKVNIGGRLR